ncbi:MULTISPECIES: NADP-dependent oxidoreductase [unclassified Streptomyces]|uniref:NADP-dependent oxidoreductase n=1 Tax=unclassified Streptomyces TaxID=2593676 RepID=UPI001BE93174|nr:MULTISPECIES: NADP-dependent oxidoreductase [unclassified Streptomyces]MBT2403063.1 NADP-dependent oxidoreductase [Streptomyces sp. ISL-21]MBT2608302.1 NADP-dependent oxidoreductase [Streptomyces sp. ISL-87]
MTTNTTAYAVHQIARPTGFPDAAHFAYVETPVPSPAPGTALVENLLLSVDPYHRGLMDGGEGGFELNTPLEGRSVGLVVASRDPGLREGDLVYHREGWRTHALVTLGVAGTRKLRGYEGVPLEAYLSILGGTGLTAYAALTRTAALREGEDLFVSAAAGGVGTATGHIARLLGARRITGSAGSAAKVRHLTERLGFDAAFDYHDGPVGEQLAEAAPDGIDVYVDNVGGDHLEGAIDVLREYGRIAWVGGISMYNGDRSPAAPRNLFEVVHKSLRLEGVLVRNHTNLQEELEDFLVPHLRSGRVSTDTTVVQGFDRTVEAFLGVLRGDNLGKMLVRVDS